MKHIFMEDKFEMSISIFVIIIDRSAKLRTTQDFIFYWLYKYIITTAKTFPFVQYFHWNLTNLYDLRHYYQYFYWFDFRFLFSESTRLTSVGGEKALAAMIGTLGDSLESEYGRLVARLFRVFKQQPDSMYT